MNALNITSHRQTSQRRQEDEAAKAERVALATNLARKYGAPGDHEASGQLALDIERAVAKDVARRQNLQRIEGGGGPQRRRFSTLANRG